MQKLLIKGKKYLNGSIPISGSKNATLPILAASILANTAKLKNVPLEITSVCDASAIPATPPLMLVYLKSRVDKFVFEKVISKSKYNTFKSLTMLIQTRCHQFKK